VLLYKLARACVDARLADDPQRDEIVADTDNFPTDRFVLEGIATERGLTVRWITPDPDLGVTVDQVREVTGERTALVLLSHIAYRSGYIADIPGITAVAHDAGALVLWDLCHSAGSVPTFLDDWQVDVAVGCTYKYLNGGPGSPAFAYVRRELQPTLSQPIQGWMGAGDVFAMADRYAAGSGMRRFLSGTPPVVGMLALHDMLDLIEQAGIKAIRQKSLALTGYAIAWADENLPGVRIAGPRDDDRRGGHVTLAHPAMREVTQRLWARDVIPDFRFPDGLRIGLSPLSTSFAELERGLVAVQEELARG
jgi:kynureninase